MPELTIEKVSKSKKIIERQTRKALTSDIKDGKVNFQCAPVDSCTPNEFCCPDTGWR